MKALLGRKIGMTQVYDADGLLHPVTVVQAGPCTVLQVRTRPRDGYDAVQIGFDDLPVRLATKPMIGHAAKAGTTPKRAIREVRLPGADASLAAGQQVSVDVFQGVAFVDVIGRTKGKGYAGGMKRHGFKGMPASHGTERKHRCSGSIGGHASNRGTGSIKKGKRMAGHMGSARCTTRNCRLIRVDAANNLLLIRGPVPGPNGGLLYIRESRTSPAAGRPSGHRASARSHGPGRQVPAS